jgi:hypothetical protein
MADLKIAAGEDMKCLEPLTDKTDKSKVLSVLSVPARKGFLLRRIANLEFWKHCRLGAGHDEDKC